MPSNAMPPLLERKLIVVTGKGGVGKTTIALALALAGARAGRRTAVACVGDAERASELLAGSGARSVALDPERDLLAWTRRLGGPVSGRLLASSSTFQYFAAAAPGAKELVSLVRVAELCQGEDAHDLVVLDAPATGHALAMLAAPSTFAAIVRSGPLAEQAGRVRELLGDARASGYAVVAHATEMAVSETLELERELRGQIDRDIDAVIVNGAVSRRFTRAELARIAAATGAEQSATERRRRFGARAELALAAARAAEAVNRRGRTQEGQLARLRRQRFQDGAAAPLVVKVPLQIAPQLDRGALEAIAARLARGLGVADSR
jgi:anion-transporting  ArsA/GET3 family ATPase